MTIKSRLIESKLDIILYLLLHLALSIAYIEFDIINYITLKDNFCTLG